MVFYLPSRATSLKRLQYGLLLSNVLSTTNKPNIRCKNTNVRRNYRKLRAVDHLNRCSTTTSQTQLLSASSLQMMAFLLPSFSTFDPSAASSMTSADNAHLGCLCFNTRQLRWHCHFVLEQLRAVLKYHQTACLLSLTSSRTNNLYRPAPSTVQIPKRRNQLSCSRMTEWLKQELPYHHCQSHICQLNPSTLRKTKEGGQIHGGFQNLKWPWGWRRQWLAYIGHRSNRLRRRYHCSGSFNHLRDGNVERESWNTWTKRIWAPCRIFHIQLKLPWIWSHTKCFPSSVDWHT